MKRSLLLLLLFSFPPAACRKAEPAAKTAEAPKPVEEAPCAQPLGSTEPQAPPKSVWTPEKAAEPGCSENAANPLAAAQNAPQKLAP